MKVAPSYSIVETPDGPAARLLAPEGLLVAYDLGRKRNSYLKRMRRAGQEAVLDLSEVERAGRKRFRHFLSRVRDAIAQKGEGLEVRFTGLSEDVQAALERALAEPLEGVEVVAVTNCRVDSGAEVTLRFAAWAREPVMAEALSELIARDGGHCVWCQVPLTVAERRATADHVRPRSKGGPDSLDNFVLACESCNSRRGDEEPLDWLEACRQKALKRQAFYSGPDEATVLAAIARAAEAQADPRFDRRPWRRPVAA